VPVRVAMGECLLACGLSCGSLGQKWSVVVGITVGSHGCYPKELNFNPTPFTNSFLAV